MNRKSITHYAIREIMGLFGMCLALFWSAGRIDWWPAWAAVAVMLAWMTATAIVIFRLNPGLLVERMGSRKGTKRWDTVIMGSLGLTQLVRYIIAGLDQRYGWTEGFPLAIQIAALIICVAGYALFVWATASNPFFSQFFRIQTERGHVLITSGPYRYIRHPAYIGGILYELAVPILLASWGALMVSGLSTSLLVLRTALEDRTLQIELAGYMDYTHRVRYRLIPSIW